MNGAIDTNPTEAQKKAGNYAKGHMRIHGLDITIENPKGGKRSGMDKGGKPWSVTMPAHYGYIKRTEGADGDHVDAYIGPHLKSPRVYIIDQNNADTGKFDEHKTFLGFGSKGQVRQTYQRAFSDGKSKERMGHLREMSVDQFKQWLHEGDTTKPIRKFADGGSVKLADGGMPPLPEGFALDAPQGGELPPLPEGFKLDKTETEAKKASSDWSSYIPKAVSDIPKEIGSAAGSAWEGVKNLNPMGRGELGAIEGLKKTGKGLLAIPELLASPLTGAARSLIGHPMADAEHAAGKLINPEVAAKDDPEQMYNTAKGDVDTAMSAMGPSRGGLASAVRPVTAPPPLVPGPLGVTLSEGQESGALPSIQREQAALRNQLGDPAKARADEFATQQRGQLATAKERIAQGFDPFNQTIAETPQDAGALVSDSLQSTAAQRKAGVKQAYDTAKSYPGEIHADAFRDMSQTIKDDLSSRQDPVIIDDKLTPYASHAIQDIDERVSKLFIQNKADPLGAPNPQSVVGINLTGVDQMRKRLSAFRRDAFASGNAADGRAAASVLDGFDTQVDHAINNGMFNGDPRAVQAWNTARAAYADYRGTFTAGKGDPVGRVVEKILGKGNNPAAIPNDVADFMYGSSGVNPNSLNVNVTNRIKGILGDKSPEWYGVKQGLFSRLTEAGPGATDWGPGKIAQRLNKFLNGDGKEMAEAVFSPAERNLLQQYADLHRKLEVPQAGANWSNTATIVGPMLKKISGGVSAIVGGILGHLVAPGLHGVGEAIGTVGASRVSGMVTDARQVKKIAAQMPLVSDAMKKWQKAVNLANKASAPPSNAALTVASTNLARSLVPLGANFNAMLAQIQGLAAGSAGQKNNQ